MVLLHVHIPVRCKTKNHLSPSPGRKSNESQDDDVMPESMPHDTMEPLGEDTKRIFIINALC